MTEHAPSTAPAAAALAGGHRRGVRAPAVTAAPVQGSAAAVRDAVLAVPLPRLHVLLTRQDVDLARLGNQVVVVVDALVGTSTIVHALAHGAAAVWPARDAEHARAIATRLHAPVVAGEWAGMAIDGLAPATPAALVAAMPRGADVVLATTNGTVALATLGGLGAVGGVGASGAATAVYALAPANVAATAAHLLHAHHDADVLVVCAGSAGRVNLEDACCAGLLVARLQAAASHAPSDAALLAAAAAASPDLLATFRAARTGRALQAVGLDDEVVLAARIDTCDVVAALRAGRVFAVAP